MNGQEEEYFIEFDTSYHHSRKYVWVIFSSVLFVEQNHVYWCDKNSSEVSEGFQEKISK
jgi:hypothetical protein